MKKLLPFLLIFTAFFLFFHRDPSSEPHVFSGVAMTVPYRILVGHPLKTNQAKEIEQTIHKIFEETHLIYNKWNPLSELSAFNQLEKNIRFPLSDKLWNLLLETDKIWKVTCGRFDPTVETSFIGWQHIHFEGNELFKDLDGLQIDLGGIAKGKTIDELTVALLALGYSNLLVEWGGDFRAQGTHPTGRLWNLSIKNPVGETEEYVSLFNEALATSGDYEQFWITEEGRHLTHIINPLTKNPLERKKGSIISCSVQTKTCTEADALATALMLFDQGDELNRWTTNYTKEHPECSFRFIFAP